MDEMVPQQSEKSSDFLTSSRSQYNRSAATTKPAEHDSHFRESSHRAHAVSVSSSTRFGPIWDHPEDDLPVAARTSHTASASQGPHASQAHGAFSSQSASHSTHLPQFTHSHQGPSNLVREASGPLARAGSDAEMLHERSHLAESSSPSKMVRVIERAGSGNIPASNVTLGHHTRMGGFADYGDELTARIPVAEYGHMVADHHQRSHLAPPEGTSSHGWHETHQFQPHAAGIVGPPRMEQHTHETRDGIQEGRAAPQTSTFGNEKQQENAGGSQTSAGTAAFKAADAEAAQEAYNRSIRVVDRQGSGAIPTSKVTLGAKTRAGGFGDWPQDPPQPSKPAARIGTPASRVGGGDNAQFHRSGPQLAQAFEGFNNAQEQLSGCLWPLS